MRTFGVSKAPAAFITPVSGPITMSTYFVIIRLFRMFHAPDALYVSFPSHSIALQTSSPRVIHRTLGIRFLISSTTNSDHGYALWNDDPDKTHRMTKSCSSYRLINFLQIRSSLSEIQSFGRLPLICG